MSEEGKIGVHIALPNQGSLHKDVMVWVGYTIENKEYQEKYHFSFNFNDKKVIDNNRNTIVKEFLEDENAQYLLFMDADNPPVRPSTGNPIDLVALDLDVVACPTPVWNNKRARVGGFPIYFNCMDWVSEHSGWAEHHPQKGLQEIDAAGTGCMLIARRVLEKVKPAFKRNWDDDGCITHGSDFLFCQRAKDEGFKVWAHYGYLCHHYKELDILEVAQSMRMRDISSLNDKENPNTSEYWNDAWDNRDERVLDFYEGIAKQVNGHKVLDFGCGRGDLLAMLGDQAEGMDLSEKAVEICRDRGLKARVGTEPDGQYDIIVCTEVLEHLDDDVGMLKKMLDHAPRVIFSVPNDCLPPGLEPEHRRVYHAHAVGPRFRPHVKKVTITGNYLVCEASREE